MGLFYTFFYECFTSTTALPTLAPEASSSLLRGSWLAKGVPSAGPGGPAPRRAAAGWFWLSDWWPNGRAPFQTKSHASCRQILRRLLRLLAALFLPHFRAQLGHLEQRHHVFRHAPAPALDQRVVVAHVRRRLLLRSSSRRRRRRRRRQRRLLRRSRGSRRRRVHPRVARKLAIPRSSAGVRARNGSAGCTCRLHFFCEKNFQPNVTDGYDLPGYPKQALAPAGIALPGIFGRVWHPRWIPPGAHSHRIQPTDDRCREWC